MSQKQGTLISLFKQFPCVLELVEPAVLAVVDLECDDGGRLEWQYPKLHVGDAAAHKEVDLICGVPLLGGKPTRQLELIVEFGVGALLEGGLDLNAVDDDGWTPLYVATHNVAELLIAAGADVNAIIASGEKKGKTALDRAVNFKQTKTVDLLRKHGGKTGAELKAEGK